MAKEAVLDDESPHTMLSKIHTAHRRIPPVARLHFCAGGQMGASEILGRQKVDSNQRPRHGRSMATQKQQASPKRSWMDSPACLRKG